jgi:uncharacterized membrane protein YkvI
MGKFADRVKGLDVGGLVVVLAAVLYLLLPPFLEGTTSGWRGAGLHRPTFAEQVHEPKLTAYYGLNYLAVVGIATGLKLDAKLKKTKDMAYLIGGLVIWFVIVARVAVATHATDHVHSIVQVPFFSIIPGVLTASLPAGINLVQLLRHKKSKAS